jgi:hypothetical protein
METAVNTTFGQALELIALLPIDEQEALLETAQHRLTERRREEIALDAKATLTTVSQGSAQFGNIADLRRDLLDEK